MPQHHTSASPAVTRLLPGTALPSTPRVLGPPRRAATQPRLGFYTAATCRSSSSAVDRKSRFGSSLFSPAPQLLDSRDQWSSSTRRQVQCTAWPQLNPQPASRSNNLGYVVPSNLSATLPSESNTGQVTNRQRHVPHCWIHQLCMHVHLTRQTPIFSTYA